jgi:NAD(P)-dependent dehydrogenase (short-subunit alcohol dehydrogenase family)
MNVEKQLAGRVAIVTGGGQGVGAGIAIALANEGARLVLVGRSPDTLASTSDAIAAAGGEARHVQGTVAERATAERAVQEALAAFGALDVLVNNAHTFAPAASLETIPDEHFRMELDTGFFGTVHFMQAAFPHMRERGGSIINIGSYAAVHGSPRRSTYAATKEAIRALSRTAARDWGRYRIRVNVINPWAYTPAVERRVAREYLREAEASTALGYIGDAEKDIGPVAVFLASDDSHYVTGQTINVEGGWWMF